MTAPVVPAEVPSQLLAVGGHLRSDRERLRNPGAYTGESDDCRAAVETLKSRGVRFDTDLLEFPWGYPDVFQPSEGNRLQLRELRVDG